MTELVLKICQTAANALHITGLHQNIFEVLKCMLQIVLAVSGDN
jgi:hypothetical protein